ncbi:MAG: NrfD/PsrC family molybdoenzyme membrane anchor subunit, partial [Eggerthella lenta]
FLAVANLMYVPFVRAGARKAAEAACLAVSLCMMAYTGVYVGWIEAVALWNNAATPALFALSSLSAGVSTVFVIAPFVRDVTRLSGWMLLLHRVHLAVLVLELVMLAGFVAFGFSNPFARESLAILFDPSGAARTIGAVGSGRRSVVTVTKLVRAAGELLYTRRLVLRFCVVCQIIEMRGCRRCIAGYQYVNGFQKE